jgi:hypothetical protein
MSDPVPILIENAIQIAWDYLEQSGELGDPNVASRVLLKSVESMIFRGERRRLMLSNRAIDDYRKFKSERELVIVT